MPTHPPRCVQLTGACSRVHGDRFADDEAIADEFSDGLPRVGVGNLADFIWIEPDLALTAADDGSSQTLLCS